MNKSNAALWRARVVFNGPAKDEHVFYSIAKRSEQEIDQMLADMKATLVYAVSVEKQWSASPENRGPWHIVRPLGLMEDWW